MRNFSALAFAAMLAARARAATIEIMAGDDFEKSCLDVVQPGDTCYLEAGNYEHDGITKTHGKKDARITITGDAKACIKGSNTQDRVLQIAHDWYTVKDICFDGEHGKKNVATAIYVLGADHKSDIDVAGATVKSSVTGLQLFDLEIRNFGSECVHYRYFVTGAEMKGCTIQHCGIEAFEQGGGGKVGEACYVGTALDQVDDNKAPEVKLRKGKADNVDADNCSRNHFHHNTFRTYGNECIDVKEGSTNNLIEYNICEQQRDPNSGGFDLRGDGNIVRFNEISNCDGAGVRVGGDDKYGAGNHVYGNVIKDMGAGAFNVMQKGQGTVCENKVSGVSPLAVGAHKSEAEFSEDVATGTCSEYTDDTGLGDSGSTPNTNTGGADNEESPDSAPDSKKRSEDTPENNTDKESKDSDTSNNLDAEEDKNELEAGVNFTDEAKGAEPKIIEITTNSAAGSSGQGECGSVVGVVKAKVDHAQYADPGTEVGNLFDADSDTYFSVHRESTRLTFELEKEVELDGVAIGFFMKAAEEQRIQTFDISVRGENDDEWTTVISRKESSGEMGVMQTFPFSSVTALYVRFESHGNSFNNWTALYELEICAKAAAQDNALFGGIQAMDQELQALSGQVCSDPSKLSPAEVVASSGHENVESLFDGSFDTRWTTENTQEKSDHNNDKIQLQFQGDIKVSHLKMAFFDGNLARQYFSVYTKSARANTWTKVLTNESASKNNKMQVFQINKERVTDLFIVCKGNEVGAISKISEIEVQGC